MFVYNTVVLMLVRYEVDMLGKPPIFQKGYLSGIACVAEIVK